MRTLKEIIESIIIKEAANGKCIEDIIQDYNMQEVVDAEKITKNEDMTIAVDVLNKRPINEIISVHGISVVHLIKILKKYQIVIKDYTDIGVLRDAIEIVRIANGGDITIKALSNSLNISGKLVKAAIDDICINNGEELIRTSFASLTTSEIVEILKRTGDDVDNETIGKEFNVAPGLVKTVYKRRNLITYMDEIISMYRSGDSVTDIVGKFHVRDNWVSDLLYVNGMKTHHRSIKGFEDDILELFKKGESVSSICERLNLERRQVVNFIKRLSE